MVTALFPGSFDPLTNGHVDLIARAHRIFDALVVGVGINPRKDGWLPVEQRVRLVEESLARTHLHGIRVVTYTGLTVDAARASGAQVIIRGIRSEAEWPVEFTQASANTELGVETLLLPTSPKWSALSSSVVRELVTFGAPADGLVPGPVAAALRSLGPPGAAQP